MLLSILTPTRDYGRFLPDALHSVRAQGDGEVEHVVVDGARPAGPTRALASWPPVD